MNVLAGLAAIVMALGPIFAAMAKDDALDHQLKAVERALQADRNRARTLQEGADKLARDIRDLRTEMVAAAKAIQGHETELSAMAQRLAGLEREAADKLSRLNHRRGQLAQTLAALQRLALYPQETVIAQPMSSADSVRSVVLLRTTVPRLEQRTERLQAELTALASLREDILDQRSRMATASETMARERRRLSELLNRKAQIQARTASERQQVQRRMQALADEAKDLRDLLLRLDRNRRWDNAGEQARRQPAQEQGSPPGRPIAKAPTRAAPDEGETKAAEPRTAMTLPPTSETLPFSTARGRLVLPARGRIVRHYGEKTGVGIHSKGLRIQTRPDAQVVAPYDGRIVFAGPFRGYGLMLIIQHGEGYHTLLAGLSRLDGVPGQWALAGEPIGAMGLHDGGEPVLYVELRHNGQPINPLPWLAALKS